MGKRRARARTGLINAGLVATSILFTLGALEGLARMVLEPRTSGAGMGILHREFRDQKGAENGLIPPTQPQGPFAADGGRGAMIFLGDSFTNGHGVPTAAAFPQQVGAILGEESRILSLGVNGDNTPGELVRLREIRPSLTTAPTVVVHQYVGNDIDYLTDIQIHPPGGRFLAPALMALAQVSYLADYLYQPYFMAAIGDKPLRDLLAVYGDPRIATAHRTDLKAIWSEARAAGASVIFVVFPFAFDQEFLDLSDQIYVKPLVAFFADTCQHGDGVLDVTELIRSPPLNGSISGSVVNPVDAHPSRVLHTLVAREIAAFLRGKPSRLRACGEGTPRAGYDNLGALPGRSP